MRHDSICVVLPKDRFISFLRVREKSNLTLSLPPPPFWHCFQKRLFIKAITCLFSTLYFRSLFMVRIFTSHCNNRKVRASVRWNITSIWNEKGRCLELKLCIVLVLIQYIIWQLINTGIRGIRQIFHGQKKRWFETTNDQLFRRQHCTCEVLGKWYLVFGCWYTTIYLSEAHVPYAYTKHNETEKKPIHFCWWIIMWDLEMIHDESMPYLHFFIIWVFLKVCFLLPQPKQNCWWLFTGYF